ncbi:putative serine/arginine-rich splicing factor SR45 isoform X2 [Iris pallida]|uniref:Serine/arginine-rich splicing factor SR45 isoform X2 n=1 Tax=Iris pallida TaxID=29817 RepID=A0AAX6FUA8_IRIPA|nr:putative serine/arginine-rich splicing factor SR45 isoform X2 [Iris pallida]
MWRRGEVEHGDDERGCGGEVTRACRRDRRGESGEVSRPRRIRWLGVGGICVTAPAARWAGTTTGRAAENHTMGSDNGGGARPVALEERSW